MNITEPFTLKRDITFFNMAGKNWTKKISAANKHHDIIKSKEKKKKKHDRDILR